MNKIMIKKIGRYIRFFWIPVTMSFHFACITDKSGVALNCREERSTMGVLDYLFDQELKIKEDRALAPGMISACIM
jgi:hypothetical protein